MALTVVPVNGQSLASSKPQVAGNFSTISTTFEVDHVAYNTGGNSGMHNQIQLPPHIGAIPAVAGNFVLFNQNAAPTNVPDIWLGRGAAAPFPLTGYVLGGTNPGNGWCYLPSGLKMAWGRSTTGGSNTVTITYSNELTNFPGFTTINAFPQLTRLSGAGNSANFVTLTAYNQTTFQVYASAGGNNVQFAWFVIGI